MIIIVNEKEIVAGEYARRRENRAIAREAQAERERRAKIAAEYQAAVRLGAGGQHRRAAPGGVSAAHVADHGGNLVEKNSTIIFPAPFMSTVRDAIATLARDQGDIARPISVRRRAVNVLPQNATNLRRRRRSADASSSGGSMSATAAAAHPPTSIHLHLENAMDRPWVPKWRASALAACVLMTFGAARAAEQEFPFGRELMLDVAPMTGSKRVPMLDIDDKGIAEIGLWCNSVKGQMVVAGDTITIVTGQKTERSCPPERAQADDDVLSALNEVTNWRRDGEDLVLIGTRTMRFRLQTN